MALSMDEQRMLDEMERKLADTDPLLASRLTSFGRPGLSALLRARRVRIILSSLALIVVATVSLCVYALTPFRASFDRSIQGRTTAQHTSQQASRSARSSGTTRQP
jgi:hypothetical protein